MLKLLGLSVIILYSSYYHHLSLDAHSYCVPLEASSTEFLTSESTFNGSVFVEVQPLTYDPELCLTMSAQGTIRHSHDDISDR